MESDGGTIRFVAILVTQLVIRPETPADGRLYRLGDPTRPLAISSKLVMR